jgi:hypothetical protein
MDEATSERTCRQEDAGNIVPSTPRPFAHIRWLSLPILGYRTGTGHSGKHIGQLIEVAGAP